MVTTVPLGARLLEQCEAVTAASPLPGGAPGELLLFRPGWVRTTHSKSGLMDEQAAARVLADFAGLGRDLVIDYEHATHMAEQRHDGTAPAAGWITALRWDPQRGLLARVRWLPKAAGMIARGEYRFYSPSYLIDKRDRRISALLSAALTNDPATIGIKPIAASRRVAAAQRAESKGDSKMNRIAEMLGLPPGASEDEILSALEAALGQASNPGDGGQIDGKRCAALATRLGLGAVQSEEELVAAARARMEKPPGFVPAAEVEKLELRIRTLEADKAKAEFETFCASGKGKGRIPPAMKAELEPIFLSDRARCEKIVAALPALAGEGSDFAGDPAAAKPPAGGQHPYEAELDEVCASRKVSRLEAIRIVRTEKPELFRSYRSERWGGPKAAV